MDIVLQDLRYAVRMLLKNPGSTLVAIFALTLGIGANSAIFSVVNSVLLRPLAYKSPERLAILWEANPGKNIHEFYASPPDYRDWVEQARSFEAIAGFRPHPSILTGAAVPERLDAASVTPRIFELLGAGTALGRLFLDEEGQPGKNHSVILSYGLWQRRFGGNKAILGQSIPIDGASYVVVGVMESQFRLLDTPADLWMPYTFDAKELKERGFHTLKTIARLKSGVSLEQARQEMQGIMRGLERQYPDTNNGWTVEPVLVHDQLVGNIRSTLWTLLGAVIFVLLIACSNVAILLLTRASGRQKEIAMRAALGASQWRIVRQMLTESVLLSLISGFAGLWLAYAGIAGLIAIGPTNIPRVDEIHIDWQVAGLTLGVCVFTGIIFGMFPALTATRAKLNDVLRVAGRVSMGTVQTRRTRSMLVVAEIALSVALLISAGLMIRSFAQLQNVNPGFRPDHVITMQMALPETRYKGIQVAQFYQKLVERVRVLPGVRSAAVARNVPLSASDPSLNFIIENRPVQASADQARAKYRSISAEYFTAMGIPLIKGSYFSRSDGPNTPGVVIINETMARQFWPNEDPLGKHIRAGFDDSPWCTIMGVVGNVKHAGLENETSAEMYYSYLQIPPALMNFIEGSMTLVARTETDPEALASAIRNQIRELDRDQPVFHVKTMEQMVNGSIAQPRFRAVLLSVFAGVALLLAVIGLYGVISYSVSQRSGEMGIRAALGAGKGDLVRLVLGEGARLAVFGVLVGVALAFAVIRTLAKLLYGVQPADPVTFTVAPLILLAVALLAIYIPARRASRVDPVIAMR